jgi:hypothetical protein
MNVDIVSLLYTHELNHIVKLFFQVALIVFLSHIGSFVPADAATVGLTDRFDLHISNNFLQTAVIQ